MKQYISTSILTLLFTLFSTLSLNAQDESQKGPIVFNAAEKEDVEAYNKLKLDETHPNLLDPRIAKGEHQKIIASWTELHKSIGEYLGQQNFSWENDGESVSIWQKIYFTPDGKVSHYFYNVANQKISKEKKEEFGRLVSDFVSGFGISITRPEQFAQCGKTRY